MAMDEDNSRLIDQVGQEILKPYQEPIKSIYIDADFLYDYRLGALLLKSSGKEQYEYILKHIPAYEKGASRKITKYFPDLKVTEKELDLLERDTGMEVILHSAAPGTKFLNDLPGFLTCIHTYNRSKVMTAPFRIIINQRVSPMPNHIWTKLVNYIRQHDSVSVIERTNFQHWDEMPESFYQDLSFLCVHDLVDFVSYGTVSRKSLRERNCFSKIILSPKQTEEDYDDPKVEAQALANFTVIMSTLVSEFSFVDKSIPIRK